MLAPLAATMLWAAVQQPTSLPDLSTDGAVRPRRTETTFRFDCVSYGAEFSYFEDNLPFAVEGVRNARQVRFARLKYNRRLFTRRSLGLAPRLVESFASIASVRGTCFRGSVEVIIEGISRSDWIAFVEGRLQGRPQTRVATFRLSSSGVTRADEPR